uniref:Uncharacterized protein n=1 Tax=Mycena chlorophos TaxID=658473 RepID=A0ABQ0L341_MYCCL|nr:predicted protein [Mycena chlorophos]
MRALSSQTPSRPDTISPVAHPVSAVTAAVAKRMRQSKHYLLSPSSSVAKKRVFAADELFLGRSHKQTSGLARHILL